MTGIIIAARAPFDFEASARFLRYTEAERVDTFHDETYLRAVHLGNRLRLMQVRPVKTASRATSQLAVTLTPQGGARAAEKAAALVARMFSVEHNLKNFRACVADDTLMREIEQAHRGLRLVRWPSLFEA